jgi:K+-sensing histidine kinase KdpD
MIATTSETEFEDIVSLAAKICDAPVSFIGFVNNNRLKLMARQGLSVSDMAREDAICEHVIKTKQVLIVEDLQADSRFADNVLARGTSGLRFYMGFPITTQTGHTLGTLCVADYIPRKITENQISCMSILVKQILVNFKSQNKINEKLMDTNKACSLGMFSIYMAHEINNYLTIIGVYTTCAINELSKNNNSTAVSNMLGSIQGTSSRIGKIVNGIKIYSRNAKTDPFERTSVKNIMQETLAICKERCKIENIGLKISLQSDDLFIKCHASEIIQVMINLINNSIDAVTFMSHKWIKAEVKLIDHNVEFSITDSGPGVPKDIANKLMQPFFTTKERGKGTGLGLYISKSIIEFHSGTFFLDDHSPTRFGFLVPSN